MVAALGAAPLRCRVPGDVSAITLGLLGVSLPPWGDRRFACLMLLLGALRCCHERVWR